jgi:hypothetical protein
MALTGEALPVPGRTVVSTRYAPSGLLMWALAPVLAEIRQQLSIRAVNGPEFG